MVITTWEERNIPTNSLGKEKSLEQQKDKTLTLNLRLFQKAFGEKKDKFKRRMSFLYLGWW